MDEQLPLFDAPPPPAVATATRTLPAGRVTYRRLTLCVRVLCDDCTLGLQQNGWIGPAPLHAAWERIVDDVTFRLCHPHFELARREDRRAGL